MLNGVITPTILLYRPVLSLSQSRSSVFCVARTRFWGPR